MEKHTSYAAMMRLRMPVPKTVLLPPKEYDEQPDLERTLTSYAQLFDLRQIGEEVGYPAFLKPFDGGAWRGVSRVEGIEDLQQAYDESGREIMHLQAAVDPFDLFVRVLGVGPQTNVIRYDPESSLHDRYKVDFDFVDDDELALLQDMTLTINSFFGWDFNSVEALRRDGVFHLIDFANANPDSQVTSFHYHIPWLVTSLIRWSLFCAATKRPMRHNPDWAPYFAAADKDMTYRERLAAYATIAAQRFDTERFEDFCASSLGELDEIAVEYFGTDRARDAVRRKVEALYPVQEVDEFTDHFCGLLDFWRKTERDRLSSNR